MKPWQAILLSPIVGSLAALIFLLLIKYFLHVIGVVVICFVGICILAPFVKSEEGQ
ncbi:hypothetical protein P4K49_30725 [Bacillus cereus]|uniref:hypothetical protein n=1 Tax=Bacillus cereus group TaxID=86661 RepID=UPI000AE21659|nr:MULTISPECIES: hypothetical protein [Bacillus cereus group]MCU5278218.1 hypothetical protein [Bacillus cereus]MEB9710318.1 hypothetical protein [Bacillus cereus]MEB9734230.1 hypothetical protein [Bacillus cereus]MEC3274392.1 hypothetical protein [Bacillus thuringiensis]MEC3293591.1 hypothetical protein [Bacillus thuringiensis]